MGWGFLTFKIMKIKVTYKVKKGMESMVICSQIGVFKLVDKIPQYKLKELFDLGFTKYIEKC